MLLILLLLIEISLINGQLYPTDTNPPHDCDNYGLCASNPDPTVTNYTCPVGNCVCQNGTTGSLCETIIDSCSTNPCPAGEYNCTNTITGPLCTCLPGYTGSNCDTSISNPCAFNPCYNGGTCSSTNNVSYTCSCPKNYLSPQCQYQNPCLSNQCLNGGTCYSIWDGANFLCSCPTGYWDRLCNSSIYVWANNSQQYQGCYSYDLVLEDSSKYKKFTDNQMTYSKCQNLMESQVSNPPYTFFTVMQQNCYISTKNYLNSSSLSYNSFCNSSCPGDNSQICGTTYQKVLVTLDDQYSTAPQKCTSMATSTCLNSTGHGMCISMPPSFSSLQYLCICQQPYVQLNNRTECGPSTVCTPNPCLNGGTCTQSADGITYTCDCVSPYTGDTCSALESCDPNPCLYGGTCTDNRDGTYTCACLPYYHGNNCQDIDICEYANPCINGTCHNNGTGIEIWPWCTCSSGFTGTYCDKMINYCTTYRPCKYNATCQPSFKDYTCTCIPGTTGKNCTTIINNCVPYTDPTTGQTYKTRCNTKDPEAVCVNAINSFSCNCSSLWTQEYCDLNVIIEQVMISIYGKMDPTMLPLLNNLMQTPAMITDMVPFIIGTLSPEQRSNLSWSFSDMFDWATYEEKELVPERDFVEWNDVVLGNCFTFNHPDSTQFYKIRSSEKQGGLRVRLKVNQAEYEPWTDTAAILVFIHYMNDYVMSESVRYNAEPNSEVIFFPLQSKYTRLGGVYGTCINNPSEVKAFYFPGAYTTDGCLRSCYQDMVVKACGCMDPRYPMPSGADSCAVSNMTCIDDASSAAGDPSTWPSCICPLPCSNLDFAITWSKSGYRSETANCIDSSNGNWNSTCQSKTADTVIVQVTQPKLVYNLFQETPTMDFNHLIGNLGALLGVLMGICAITFIEFAVMLFRVICIFCCCNSKKQ